jgi:hypothetical protein
MRRSFKTIEHNIIVLLGRYGYTLNQKLKDVENTDTKIYTKGLLDGCTVSIHRGDVSSITLSFSENYIQMLFSALIVVTFDSEGKTNCTFVEHIERHKYESIYKEIKEIIT